jgi:hypothetical protein
MFHCSLPKILFLLLFSSMLQVAPQAQPTHAHGPLPERSLRFAILADNTGGERPGVLARAVEKLNLMAPF